MKTLKTLAVALSFAGLLASGSARADDAEKKPGKEFPDTCYVCESYSRNGCTQCPYDIDTRGRRKGCERAGCVIAKANACSKDPKVKTCEGAR